MVDTGELGQPEPTGNPAFPSRRTLPSDLASELRTARQRLFGIRHGAKVLGIDRGYLSRLERGLRCPGRGVAERLIAVLGLDEDVADALRREADLTRPMRPQGGW